MHAAHLRQVFSKLHTTGLTLKGSKCHIGMSSVSYLGNSFAADRTSPDPEKTQAVSQWPIPTDVKAVRQLLGLASYYQRYIKNFASIAFPLHHLTQKTILFSWTQECEDAFSSLKHRLLQSPVLMYPKFTSDAYPFVLQTDASAMGPGAVLEQGKQIIAYASRALTKPEKLYTVISTQYAKNHA